MSPADKVTRPPRTQRVRDRVHHAPSPAGWTDCLAAARNATVDAWDRLTTTPTVEDGRLYRLRADLATGTYDGRTFDRYQYKITNGGRIWYFVDLTPAAKVAGRVLLERCEPGHPKETEHA